MRSTIIVPLDGSNEAESALPVARALAARNNARLTLASVIEVSLEFDAWVETAMLTLDEELDDWIAERREYVEGVARGIDDLETNVEILVGQPADQIAALADDLDDPMIVIASHGRGGVAQVVIGSVTFRIVHDVHCPVVVVRIPDQPSAEPAPSFEHIMIPLDGSEFSAAIIERALDALGEPKPAVLLLHVLDGSSWAGRTIHGGLIRQYVEAINETAEEHLTKVSARIQGLGYEVSHELRTGNVTEQIQQAARDHGVGMIAMATHGRGGLGRALLGSVAQRLLQNVELPLLLIRPEKQS